MRVLVPVDGSSYSMEAVNKALDYAQMKGAEIYLLNVVPPVAEFSYGLWPSQGEALRDGLMKRAEEIVAEAKAVLVENGITPRCIAKDTINTVAEEICDFAENEGIDLVIIGSRGFSELSRFLMGSVASRVARYCPCSVLLVRMS